MIDYMNKRDIRAAAGTFPDNANHSVTKVTQAVLRDRIYWCGVNTYPPQVHVPVPETVPLPDNPIIL
jgi:hypothetical protein